MEQRYQQPPPARRRTRTRAHVDASEHAASADWSVFKKYKSDTKSGHSERKSAKSESGKHLTAK